jgi:serine/threonine protein phosphatase PrpC
VGYAVEAGLLEVDEALHHEERHLVSNLVGSADMHIEIGPSIELSPSDTVIVASDGLFDNVHQDEIAALSRKGTLLSVLHQLAGLSKQRMEDPEPGMPSKPDDATIIVYRQRATTDAAEA